MENDVFSGSPPIFGHSHMLLDPTPSYMLTGPLWQPDFSGNSSHRQTLTGNPLLSTMQEAAAGDAYLTSNGVSGSSDMLFPKNVLHIGDGPYSSFIGNHSLHEHLPGAPLSPNLIANLFASSSALPASDLPSEDMRVPASLASPHCSFGTQHELGFQNQNELLDQQMPSAKACSVVRPSYHVNGSWQPGWNLHKTGWNFSCTYGNPYPAPGSELSLSLGSCHPCVTDAGNVADQCSELSCSAVTQVTSADSSRLELREKFSLCPGSSGLLQLYLHAVQEVLAEIVNYALEDCNGVDDPADGIDSGAKMSFSSSSSRAQELPMSASDDLLSFGHAEPSDIIDPQKCEEDKKKKVELLSMLQLVDHSYNQCLDRIQNAAASFLSAVHSSNSDTHARFVLHTISPLYIRLRKRITSQILLIAQQPECERERARSISESSLLQKQWALKRLRKSEHQSWRPQRGLPEKSVSVLRAWMFDNFLHPYPKDGEKHFLAIKSGLSRSQVSNWFINARVRLWKPMIEEMYAEVNKKKSEEGLDGESMSQANLCSSQSFRIS